MTQKSFTATVAAPGTPATYGQNQNATGLGWQAASVLVNNNTNQFLFVNAANDYCPPNTVGWSRAVDANFADAMWQAPPGSPIQPVLLVGQTAQLIFYDAPVPASNGVAASSSPGLGFGEPTNQVLGTVLGLETTAFLLPINAIGLAIVPISQSATPHTILVYTMPGYVSGPLTGLEQYGAQVCPIGQSIVFPTYTSISQWVAVSGNGFGGEKYYVVALLAPSDEGSLVTSGAPLSVRTSPALFPDNNASGSFANGGTIIAAPGAGLRIYLFNAQAFAAAADGANIVGIGSSIGVFVGYGAGSGAMGHDDYPTPIKFPVNVGLKYVALSVAQNASINLNYTIAA